MDLRELLLKILQKPLVFSRNHLALTPSFCFRRSLPTVELSYQKPVDLASPLKKAFSETHCCSCIQLKNSVRSVSEEGVWESCKTPAEDSARCCSSPGVTERLCWTTSWCTNALCTNALCTRSAADSSLASSSYFYLFILHPLLT